MKPCCCFLILVMTGYCSAELPKYSIKTAKVDTPADLKKEIQELLPAESVQLRDENGAGILKLWFVKNIVSTASAEQLKNGLTYREWSEGSLVGAVHLEQPWVDYRKQTIAAGIYTLRVAFQPDTGDHKDTAPGTEFLLLVPAVSDMNAEPLASTELVKLSKKSTGSDHASVMLLLSPKDAGKTAELKTSDNTLSVLQQIPVKTTDSTGTVGVQVVVWGHSVKR